MGHLPSFGSVSRVRYSEQLVSTISSQSYLVRAIIVNSCSNFELGDGDGFPLHAQTS